ncbi:Uma2 family endonuclease [[Limnothrix rosea] IAM M-220]|uniref:Uma2 family endonuclease n=1 Tax=[Limnothrix rosea] IAM M-220 TaxID=454133 RepID=UPI001C0D9D8D|nr:Uma2 family endonuclease [[Limnothrix rosea] IAM M-220]
MTATLSREMTLEEYLQFDDGSEKNYELEDGVLREMPPESELNKNIALWLLLYFAGLGIPPSQLSNKTEITVPGLKASSRFPDLMVLSKVGAIALKGASRSTIFSDMPAPEIVVEVVSPGRENSVRDYRHKRAQYQARGIQEYWIVDPQAEKVTILTLNEWLYDEAIFTKDQAIASAFLENLNVESYPTVAKILQMEND